jgi:hypothetical protein
VSSRVNSLKDRVTADCARRIAGNEHDPCGAIRPDLPKVV